MTTVLYDRDCGFCRWCVSKLLAWDRARRLRPVAIQDPEGQRLLERVPEADRLASWHLIGEDGEIHSAGEGFPPLFRELPGAAPLAALAARAPGPVDRGYRLIAGNRSRLGPLLSDGAKRRADRRIADRASGRKQVPGD
jgi:predicted DCC family thiol-disulfide oxidoreductase YuxK